MSDDDESLVPSAAWWVWVMLIILALAAFWGMATVTEERMVPALTLISNRLNIPEDVTGCTMMAAGASSPELFSSVIALFITHSSVGLGTVVGSEIFNQLTISAAAVLYTKSGKLTLNRRMLTRECSFYLLAIVLLYLALRDTHPVPGDKSEHIFISFGDALMVFLPYIVYVLVCSYFDAIIEFVGGKRLSISSDGKGSYGSVDSNRSQQDSIDLDDVPFIQNSTMLREPAGNFTKVQFDRIESNEENEEPSKLQDSSRSFEKSLKNLAGSMSSSLRDSEFLMEKEKPSDQRGLYEVMENTEDESLGVFLWQRSYFYSRARADTRGWHLRWFTFFPEKVESVPDRWDSVRHTMKYPPFTEIRWDPERLIIRIVSPIEGKGDYFLMAPSKKIFETVVAKLNQLIKYHKSTDSSERAKDEDNDIEHVSNHETLIQFPHGAPWYSIVIYVFFFPMRVLVQYTTIDIRQLDQYGNPVGNVKNAMMSLGLSVAWLIVLSFVMVKSMETLASLMNIPDQIVGVTVSAIGTSLPNFVASTTSAKQGFGNAAIANAFGSNNFNIMVALGLPWALYTSFGTGFKPYHALKSEGIVQSVLILLGALVFEIATLIPTGFVMYKWHAYVYLVAYALYLTYAIGSVYW